MRAWAAMAALCVTVQAAFGQIGQHELSPVPPSANPSFVVFAENVPVSDPSIKVGGTTIRQWFGGPAIQHPNVLSRPRTSRLNNSAGRKLFRGDELRVWRLPMNINQEADVTNDGRCFSGVSEPKKIFSRKCAMNARSAFVLNIVKEDIGPLHYPHGANGGPPEAASGNGKDGGKNRQDGGEHRNGLCPEPFPPPLGFFGVSAAMLALGFYVQWADRGRTWNLIGALLTVTGVLLWIAGVLFGNLWFPYVCRFWNW